MAYRIRRFGYIISTSLGLLALAPALRAECGLPDSVIMLVDDLYAAAAAPPEATAGWHRRLRGAADRVDMQAVQRKLFAVGMPDSRARVEAILRQAQRFGAPGYAMDTTGLRQQLRLVERLDALVCKLETAEADDRSSPSKGRVGQARARMEMPFTSGQDNTMGRIIALLGIVSGMILFIVGLQFAYNWLYALTHNRRTCRIQAEVEKGLDIVDGHVTILGLKGCRFQPVNEGAMARLEELAHTSYITLYVDGTAYAMSIGGTYGHFAALFFDAPLTRPQQRAILRLSSVPPRYVPKGATTRQSRAGRRAARQRARTAR